MKKVLSIAGSDCSGGAGIQADLKTVMAHGMYGMSAVTALTAQNTTGVFGVLEAGGDFVARQLDAIFEDIRPDAVKIGMVASSEMIEVIGQKLRQHRAEHVVVDPVMISTSGSRLLMQEAVDALKAQLFPLAEVITPNLMEAQSLCGFPISGREDMVQAARQLAAGCCGGVLIKGGHLRAAADDLLLERGELHWFCQERLDNPNTHGTGCTLSSAIACNLAAGHSLAEAVRLAKEYLTGALGAGLDLGRGSGPLDHGYRFREG